MLEIEIRTIFICVTVTELVLGLGMVLFWRTQRTYDGFGFWAACNILVAAAYLLFALRGAVTDFWSVVVANVLILTAISVRIKGIRLFLRAPPWPWRMTFWVPAASALVLAYFTLVQDDVLLRTLVVTIVLVAVLVECAWLLLSSATPSTRLIYWSFSSLYVIYALLMLARLVLWIVAPENRGLLNPTPINLAVNLLLIPLDIAVTMAYLMMNSQRMQEELVASETAERQQRILTEALRSSTATLNSSLELQKVLNQILSNAGRVVLHDAADVMLIDPTTGVTNFVECEGYEKFGGPNHRAHTLRQFRVRDTVNLHQVAAAQRPHIIGDVRLEPRWVWVEETAWIRSNLTAPIVIEGEVAGFLCLNSATPGFFSLDQAERLAAFADQAAIAIKNARLFADVQHYAAELEARNQELDAFAHTVAHDLKNPLWGMVGTAELLESDGGEMTPDERHAFLHELARSGHKMNSIIEEILVLAGVHQAGKVEFESLDMPSILAEARARLHYLNEEYGATIAEPATWPAMVGHAAWVEEVWVNYLSNAIKYGGEYPQISVGASALGNGMVRCWVRDNGAGIAPEQQKHLFGAFTRLDAVRFEGSGLGLSIVKHIVSRLGGEVGVESSGIEGEGSTFSFTLPAV